MLIPIGFFGGAVASSYELITTNILSTSQSSFTFSNLNTLATNYKHLQIRGLTRSSTNTDYTSAGIRFNGDSGANYSAHEVVSDGVSMSSGGGSSQTSPFIWRISGATAASGIFGGAIIDILDFSSTSKNKTVKALSGVHVHGSPNAGTIQLTSAAWYNTSAITSITFVDATGGNFVAGSRFSIYGIRS